MSSLETRLGSCRAPASPQMDNVLPVMPGGVYRVYALEWTCQMVAVTGIDEDVDELVSKLARRRDEHYARRISLDRLRITTARRGKQIIGQLQALVPVRKGEFKTLEQAEEFTSGQSLSGVAIVERGSAEEKALLDQEDPK